MPTRRQHKNILSPEVVQGILQREALIKAGKPLSKDSWSDSASAQSQCAKEDAFGDEESLRTLYAEFAEEDRALANEGLAEFRQVMSEYDGE